VIGKFSIRLVPNMTPQTVEERVCNYIRKLHQARGSPNTLKVSLHHSGPAWVSDINHVNYQAARRALTTVHGMVPDFTRDGCSIPVTLALQNALQRNIVLLPIGACDDGAHSQNEKINRMNYIQGTKALVAYLEELGHLNK